MATQTLWSFDLLKRTGHQFNKDLVLAYDTYIRNGMNPVEPSLISAATFCALFLANMTPDSRKRDFMMSMLMEGPIEDPLAYKKMKVLKWTPVKKILDIYSRIPEKDYKPSLSRLLTIQDERHSPENSPCWGSLMPDKIYALHQFDGYGPEAFDRLLQPFGKAAQTAYTAYTGVVCNGTPKPMHYEFLRNFSNAIAHNSGTPEVSSLHIPSGLHVFGETLLQR